MNFDKTGYQPTLFPLQPHLHQTTLMSKIGLCKQNHILLFKKSV